MIQIIRFTILFFTICSLALAQLTITTASGCGTSTNHCIIHWYQGADSAYPIQATLGGTGTFTIPQQCTTGTACSSGAMVNPLATNVGEQSHGPWTDSTCTAHSNATTPPVGLCIAAYGGQINLLAPGTYPYTLVVTGTGPTSSVTFFYDVIVHNEQTRFTFTATDGAAPTNATNSGLPFWNHDTVTVTGFNPGSNPVTVTPPANGATISDANFHNTITGIGPTGAYHLTNGGGGAGDGPGVMLSDANVATINLDDTLTWTNSIQSQNMNIYSRSTGLIQYKDILVANSSTWGWDKKVANVFWGLNNNGTLHKYTLLTTCPSGSCTVGTNYTDMTAFTFASQCINHNVPDITKDDWWACYVSGSNQMVAFNLNASPITLVSSAVLTQTCDKTISRGLWISPGVSGISGRRYVIGADDNGQGCFGFKVFSFAPGDTVLRDDGYFPRMPQAQYQGWWSGPHTTYADTTVANGGSFIANNGHNVLAEIPTPNGVSEVFFWEFQNGAPFGVRWVAAQIESGDKMFVPVEGGGGASYGFLVDNGEGSGVNPAVLHTGCSKNHPYCVVSVGGQNTYTTYQITGVTVGANPTVTTTPNYGGANGDVVLIDDVGGLTGINRTPCTVASLSGATFACNGITTSGTYTASTGCVAVNTVPLAAHNQTEIFFIDLTNVYGIGNITVHELAVQRGMLMGCRQGAGGFYDQAEASISDSGLYVEFNGNFGLPENYGVFLANTGLVSCTVTVNSPASNAVIQANVLPLTSTLASCLGVARVDYLVNGRFFHSSFAPPWKDTYYAGAPGDGIATIQAIAYDVFGNKLGSSAISNFTIRMRGSATTWATNPPTSGSGTIAVNLPEGGAGQTPLVDGRTDMVTGCSNLNSFHGVTCNINTTLIPNGTREVYFNSTPSGNAWTDPYKQTRTFTSANVSGNNITLNTSFVHQLNTNTPFTLTTTGTLPTCTGCRASPLQTGSQWFWTASGQTNTVSIAVSAGVATATCNSACGVVTSDVIDVEYALNSAGVPVTGLNGIQTVANSSGVGATSFTFNVTGVANATYNNYGMQMFVHPYYGIYVDNNTIQIAETPNGAADTISGGGTGTHTVASVIQEPYWDEAGQQIFRLSGGSFPTMFAYQSFDFENGAAAMEMRGYYEVYLCLPANATTTCPSTFSIAPTGVNTDLSTFAITASTPVYTVVPDGGFSNVVTVSSSGLLTAQSAGWAQVTTACSSSPCNGLATLTTYVRVYPGAANFPTWTHDGHIAASYTAGQSFIPFSLWNIQAGVSQYHPNDPWNIVSWLGQEMQRANLNSSMEGIRVEHSQPSTLTCAAANTAQAPWDSAAQTFATNNGTYLEYYFGDITWPPWNFGTVTGAYNYARYPCIQSEVTTLKTNARTWRLFSFDEVSRLEGGNTPLHPGIVGTTDYFSQVVVTGCPGACSATATTNANLSINRYVQIINAAHSFLNGLWTGSATTNASGNVSSFTFTPVGATNGTYNASTDPSMELVAFQATDSACNVGCIHQGPLPSLAGSGSNRTIQGWDTSLTSIVVSGGLATYNWTGHGLTGSGAASANIIQTAGATTAGLNTTSYITRVGSNSFTVPTTAANGTYSSSTDSGLQVIVDPGFTNHTFDTLYNTFHAGGNIAVNWAMLGLSYSLTTTQAVQEWEGTPNITGQPNIADGTFNYNPNPCTPGIYGDDCTAAAVRGSLQASGVLTRAYQTEPRSQTLAEGYQCVKLHSGFACDLSVDFPQQEQRRRWNVIAQVMYSESIGESGHRVYKWINNPNDDYNLALGGSYNGGTTGYRHYIEPIDVYNATALAGAALQRWTKYLLQPRTSVESYGPSFYASNRMSSLGGFKLVGSVAESNYTQTINLTNTQVVGGKMRRECVDGFNFKLTELGTSSTDTYTFAPGEACAWISQAPITGGDIDHITFGPPAQPLAYGAIGYAVRIGLYPRDMNYAPAIPCTNGCVVAVNHYNAAAWYQTIYTDANGAILSIGDPQQIPAQGPF